MANSAWELWQLSFGYSFKPSADCGVVVVVACSFEIVGGLQGKGAEEINEETVESVEGAAAMGVEGGVEGAVAGAGVRWDVDGCAVRKFSADEDVGRQGAGETWRLMGE